MFRRKSQFNAIWTEEIFVSTNSLLNIRTSLIINALIKYGIPKNSD